LHGVKHGIHVPLISVKPSAQQMSPNSWFPATHDKQEVFVLQFRQGDSQSMHSVPFRYLSSLQPVHWPVSGLQVVQF